MNAMVFVAVFDQSVAANGEDINGLNPVDDGIDRPLEAELTVEDIFRASCLA